MQVSAAFSFPAVYAIADSRHIPTCADGLAARIFGDVNIKEFYKNDIARAMEKYKRTIPIIPDHLFLSYQEWRDSSRLPEWRLAAIDAELREKGEGVHYVSGDDEYGCFIKYEEYDRPKAPRGIFGQSNRLKGILSPLFTTIEREFYATRNTIKHVDFDQLPNHIIECVYQFGAVNRATDYSSLEKSHSKWATDNIVFEAYKYMCQNNPDALARLELALETRARMIFKFKGFSAKCSYRLSSGCRDTSLANLIVNDFLCFYVAEWRGISEKHMTEGDDALQSTYAKTNIEADRLMLATLGFDMTFETSDSLFDLSFCGQVLHEDSRQLLTDPAKVILRFGWLPYECAGMRTNKKLALYRMRALSLLLLYPSCPIVATFCNRVLQLTVGIDHRQALRMTRNSYEREHYERVLSAYKCLREKGLIADGRIKTPEPTEATRELFAQHYNISSSFQKEIERDFRSFTIGHFGLCNFTAYCDWRSPQWGTLSRTYVREEEKNFARPEIVDQARRDSLRALVKNPDKLPLYASLGHAF